MEQQRTEQGERRRRPAVRGLTVLTSIGAMVVIAIGVIAVSAGWPQALQGDPAGLASAVDLRALTVDDEPIAPIPQPPAADPSVVRLGERLFQDTRLSRGNVRSCATCHDIRSNGASTNVFDKRLDGSPLRFNTSTVFNVALNFRLDWEGGTGTLQRSAAESIESPAMGLSLREVVAKLHADPQIDRQFRAAYGKGPDAGNVTEAIATFERSLVTPGGRFDRWLSGDTTALSPRELDGYRLFKSLGCSACHQGVNVGGNLFERHGIFHPLARRDPVILRVPSLRNVAATAPYFHDGSARTLHDAVRQMACAQLDDSLTDAQVEDIVAFLRTLTGLYHGRPVEAAPRATPPAESAGQAAPPSCAGMDVSRDESDPGSR